MSIPANPTRKWCLAAKAATGLLAVAVGVTAPALVSAEAIYGGFIEADTSVAEIRDSSGNVVSAAEEALPGDLAVSAGTAFDVFLAQYGTGVPNAVTTTEVYDLFGGSVPGSDPIPAMPTVPLTTVGEGTYQYAQVDGSALPEGGALSEVFTDGVFSFTNNGSVAYEVVLDIFYSWSVSVSVDDPFRELAALDAYVQAGLAQLMSPPSDPGGPEEWFIGSDLLNDGVSLDTFFGPLGDSFSDTVQVSFFIEPGQTLYFATFNDIFGGAESIPLPPTWLLLVLGLAGWRLGGARRGG